MISVRVQIQGELLKQRVSLRDIVIFLIGSISILWIPEIGMKWKSRIALSHSAAMLRIKSLFFCTGSLAFTCDSTRPPSECKSTEIDLLCLPRCRNNYFVVIGSVNDCLNPPYWLIICKNALIENDYLRLFRLNFVFHTIGPVKAKRQRRI